MQHQSSLSKITLSLFIVTKNAVPHYGSSPIYWACYAPCLCVCVCVWTVKVGFHGWSLSVLFYCSFLIFCCDICIQHLNFYSFFFLFNFQLVLCSCLTEKFFDIFVKMVTVGGRKKTERPSKRLTKSWRCAIHYNSCKFAVFMLIYEHCGQRLLRYSKKHQACID